jgi:hypothetical protein
LISKSIRDLHFQIDQRFSICKRDHDPDQKIFWKNRSAIFILQSNPDFEIAIAIAGAIEKTLINQDFLTDII